ncbi:MAG: DUF885 domain-containing protein, partial [Deltaproteobacteria bacterium]|nr:DUF885 domain-containing protein [Deltaproteobacteria bacterium]
MKTKITEVSRGIADKLHEYNLINNLALVFIGVGDIKQAKIPDISETKTREKAEYARTILQEVEQVAASPLSHDDEILLDIVRFNCKSMINEEKFYWNIFAAEPWFNMIPMIFSFLGKYPLTDTEYLDTYLRCLEGLAGLVVQHREKTQGQAERGIRIPKPILPYALQTYQEYRIEPDKHPLVLTKKKLSGPNVDTGEIISRSRAAIEALNSALGEMVAFLEGPYGDAVPEAVGYAQYPDGPAYYRAMVKQHTSLDITPEEIFELGETDRASIEARMAEIRRELGSDLSREAFTDKVMADPERIMEIPEEFGERLNACIDRIRPVMKEYFAEQPEADCCAERIAPDLEPLMHNGLYTPPTPGKPKGHYYYNGLNMERKNPMKTASLAYHELLPGHHFQIALTQEREELPPLAKTSMVTAYIEGWAEYAAILAGEMGMYEDLYDEYGRLEMDLYLANFLTVDTGLNAKGWSLDEMVDFMRPYLPDFTEERLLSQLLRIHFSMPGFTIAYKLGSLKFREFREKARTALGDRFDIKEFHRIVLEWGALPMTILNKHVDGWLARQ